MTPAAHEGPVRLAILLLIVAAVWSPTALNDYVLDDNTFVRADTPFGPNVMVRELRPLAEYFTRPYGYGVASVTRGYRPVTVLGYAVTHAATARQEASADPPWPHHVLDIALHLMATGLVYLMIAQLGGPGLPALAGAAVFGVHALHAEAVASIVGRGELGGFVFGATAALAWVRGARASGPTRLAWLVAAPVALFLAFGSKENALAWVVFAPLYAFLVGARDGKSVAGSSRDLVRIAVGVLAALTLYLTLRAGMLTEHVATFEPVRNPIFEADFEVRARTGTMVLGYGLYKVFWPFSLASDYGARVFEPVVSWGDPRWILAAVALAALAFGVGVALRAREPLPALGGAAFLAWGGLTSNILVPIETLFGERLYYTPVLLASFLVAWILSRARSWAKALGLVALVWIGANAWTSFERSFDWRDTATLILTDAESQPRSVWLAVEAARWHRDHGDAAERERHLERALDLDPGYAPALTAMFEASLSRALELREPRAAAAELERAVEWGRRALASGPLDPLLEQKVRQNLAVALAALGRVEQARAEHATVLALGPATAVAFASRVELCWIAYRVEREAALIEIEGLARTLPSSAPLEQRVALEALVAGFEGLVLLERGHPDEARALLGEALATLERVAPHLVPALRAEVGRP